MRAFDDLNVDEQKLGFNGFGTSAGIGANINNVEIGQFRFPKQILCHD